MNGPMAIRSSSARCVDALEQQVWLVKDGTSWRLEPGVKEAAAWVPLSLQDTVEQLFEKSGS